MSYQTGVYGYEDEGCMNEEPINHPTRRSVGFERCGGWRLSGRGHSHRQVDDTSEDDTDGCKAA
eukprot:3972880-Lingulodinium_polyedra.AAC.1